MATTSPLNPSVPVPPPTSSITPPGPPSNSSPTTVPPTVSQPSQTSNTPAPSSPSTPSTPSNSLAPPPQSPPPAVPAAPPPSPPLSPPPTATPPPTSSPPPLPPTSPTPPLPSQPPSLPATSPPPVANSPPPPILSPPPPLAVSPPQSSPPPPSVSPPPPIKAPLPPSANSPPPPVAKPPQNSPPPPRVTPPSPPGSPPAPPPPTSSPPPPDSTSSPPPPPPVPSSSSPTPVSPPAPTNSSVSTTPPISPLPSLPTQKPTARSTTPGSGAGANTISTGSGSNKAGGTMAIGIIVGLLALSLVVMGVWFTRKRKRRATGLNGGYIMSSPFASSQHSDSSFLRPPNSVHVAQIASGSNFMYSPEPGGAGNSKSWFTYEELSKATNGFSAQNLLGEGGFGCVYKGFLVDGREVAVKQLKIGGGQGEREFRAEVEIISRVHHRHLVSLVGYCISEHQRLLVYDFVPNDTLHCHLYAGEGRAVMDWATRVKVAAGAARGIAYLHEDCHPRIIHRDIKSSNILLDKNFEAQVADFGLAKLAADANTHVTTRVMGTFGYMAPEYASSGKLTEKSDVYSFGVVLLELITGRKPVDASQPLGDESLVEWARPLLNQALESERFEELADPRLENTYVETEMFRMIEAAAACIRHLASKRPRMSQVVRALDSIGEFTDLTNGMKPGQSEIFNSREQSAQIRMFQRMAFGSQEYSSEFFDHSQSSWRS
ncbi:unnamed protein product [Camellia sinensis]